MGTARILLVAREGPERRALVRDFGKRQEFGLAAGIPAEFAELDLCWIHLGPGEEPFTPDPLACEALADWVREGGRLLLSGTAAALLGPLGFERRPPVPRVRVWEGPLRPEDRLGLAPMPGAPLFHRFPGGVDLRRPYGGCRVGGAGWWGGESPEDGRLLAVERVFLGIDAHTGLLAEHRPGRGLVLSVGAHLVFDPGEVVEDPFLEARLRFTGDLCDYLMAGRGGEGPAWRMRRGKAFGGWGGETFAASPCAEEDPEALLETRSSLFREDGLPGEGAGNEFFDLVDPEGELFALGRADLGLAEVWAPPLRLLRALSVEAAEGEGEPVPLEGGRLDLHPLVASRRSEAGLVETWFPGSEPRSLAGFLHAERDLRIRFRFVADLRLYWPYPEGAQGGLLLGDGGGGAVLCECESGLGAFALALDREDLLRSLEAGEPEDGGPGVEIRFEVDLPAGELCGWRLAAGRKAGGAVRALMDLRSIPMHSMLEAHRRRVRERRSARLEISFGDPRRDRGLRFALDKSWDFRLGTAGDAPVLPGARGWFAGFALCRPGWNAARPGYAWWFGRDGLWCARAFLPFGDREGSADHLRLLARTQGPRGEIAHEITPAGTAHYDAADATPMFVAGVADHLDWTGDRDLARELFPAVERALTFLSERDRDGDGLSENEGVGHGWIEGGPLRDGVRVELYHAVRQEEAYRAGARLAGDFGEPGRAAEWAAQARRIREAIEEGFWDEERGRYAHALKTDGSFDPSPSALHLQPFLLPGRDGRRAARALAQASTLAALAPWGQRLLPAGDPRYDPRSYQGGSVWPLFGGFAALASYLYGRPDLGWLRTEALLRLVLDFDRGLLAEVLDGERYEPRGVCPHQAWSHAALLGPLVTGLLGARPGDGGRFELAPRLPDELDRLSFRRLRWRDLELSGEIQREEEGFLLRLTVEGEGEGVADLGIFAPAPSEVEGVFEGDRALPNECETFPGGCLLWLRDRELRPGLELGLEFRIRPRILVETAGKGDVRLLEREGELGERECRFLFEAPPGRRSVRLRLRGERPTRVEGAEIRDGALVLDFEGEEGRPARREVRFSWGTRPEPRGAPEPEGEEAPPRPKVLHFCHGFPPEFVGGTESYVRLLAEEQRASGWKVAVAAGSGAGAPEGETIPLARREEEGGISVWRCLHPGMFHERWDHVPCPRLESTILGILEEERPDLVHVHQWLRLSRSLVRLCRDAGLPVVLHLHDLFTTCPRIVRIREGESFCMRPLGPEGCRDCVPRERWMREEDLDALLEWFDEDFAAETGAASLLLAPSRAHARLLTRFRPDLEGRITVLPHGALFDGERRATRPLPPAFDAGRPLRIAHWGHLQEVKGVHLLLEALHRLERPGQVVLELWGEAVEAKYGDGLASLLEGIEVRRRSAFRREDLAELEADLAVFPTLAHESWSFVLDEAFALGLPVLGSERGALPERIGGAGALFPPGDAGALAALLESVLEDPARLEAWRERLPAPRSMAEHWNELKTLYAAVRETEGGPPPPVAGSEEDMRALARWEDTARRFEDRCRELDGLREKAESERAALAEALAELERSVEEYRERVEDQEADLAEHRRRLVDLEESYEAERAELCKSLEEHRRSLDEHREDLAEHRRELARVRREYAEVEEALRENREARERVESELALRTEERDRLAADLALRTKERDRLAEEIRATREVLAATQRENRRYRRVHLILLPLTWPLNRVLDLGAAIRVRFAK